MIGNYNENGQKEGPWETVHSILMIKTLKTRTEIIHSFFETGCHVETALFDLNKEDPCSKKKSSTGGE